MKISDICTFIFIAFVATQFISCEEEIFESNPDLKLEFSVDTLRFDTVFTTLGSATRILKVFNPNEVGISISEVKLTAGETSKFRINIDGLSVDEAQDLRILAKDSLYIFAEVTIDPDQGLSESPFIYEENLSFKLGNETQNVVLEAWGQNANYIPSRFSGGTFNQLSCDLETVNWDDPKPYVIYGVLVIDSCNLILPAGTEVYVHGGLGNEDGAIYNDGIFIIGSDASLNINGTVDEPVVFQGDRLEQDFENTTGQWSGIRFLKGSRGNKLEHTIVKNAITGIQVDSAATVQLDKCKIFNSASSGVLGFRGNIIANNCLIHTNGGNSFVGIYGGNYTLRYCTLANYGNQKEALRLLNYTCDDPLCLGQIFLNRLNANLFNCIITGSADEILLDDATRGEDGELFKYRFVNCAVSVDELLEIDQFQNFLAECEGCVDINQFDPLFLDIDNRDFHLDSLSIAEGLARPLSSISSDLEENFRDMETPDIGCFEYQN